MADSDKLAFIYESVWNWFLSEKYWTNGLNTGAELCNLFNYQWHVSVNRKNDAINNVKPKELYKERTFVNLVT